MPIEGVVKEGHFRHAPLSCPMCGYKPDCATPVDGGEARAPTPGAYSICQRCTSLLMFGENTLEEVSAAQWAETSDEQKHELDMMARAHERLPRPRPDLQIDIVLTRGPQDYRAAVTLKNEWFVVSPPFNTRKKAVRALRSARGVALVLGKWADCQFSADQLLQGARSGWYGAVYLVLFGQEHAASPHFGPYPSEPVARAELTAAAFKCADALGVSVGKAMVVDARNRKPGSGN